MVRRTTWTKVVPPVRGLADAASTGRCLDTKQKYFARALAPDFFLSYVPALAAFPGCRKHSGFDRDSRGGRGARD
jgi:hypothetical protein